MVTLLVILHIIVCFVLILVVLLQTGKGADLAGAFGGGGSQTALGSRGAATFLSKATTASAVIFMITSLALALVSSRRTSAILQSPTPVQQAPASKPPAVPAPSAPAGGQQAPSPSSGSPGTEEGGSQKPAPSGQPAPAQPKP
jgi:preprotein translocase subunit SecG